MKSKYKSEKITFKADFADFCGILHEKSHPNKAVFMYFYGKRWKLI